MEQRRLAHLALAQVHAHRVAVHRLVAVVVAEEVVELVALHGVHAADVDEVGIVGDELLEELGDVLFLLSVSLLSSSTLSAAPSRPNVGTRPWKRMWISSR